MPEAWRFGYRPGIEPAMPSSMNPVPAAKPHFAILVAISTVGPLSLNILLPAMPGLEKTFGVPYATVQLTLTLYLIGMALCQLIYGPASDRFGRRPMLLIGLFIFVIASIMSAIAPSIEWLIAARLLQAIGGSAGIVLARAMVRDVYTREQSASMISYITMAFVVAPMIAPIIGGLLEQYADWRIGQWGMAAVALLILLAAWRTLPETHASRTAEISPLAFLGNAVHLFRIPRFRSYTFTLAFSASVFFSFLGGAPHLMVDVLKQTPLQYGLWFITISIAYMLANFVSGTFTQRIGIDRMITLGNAVTFGGGLLALAAAVTGTLTPLTLFVPMSFAAFGNGLTIPNGTAGAISVDPKLTGAAAGWAGFTQMAVASAASQIVGAYQISWPLLMFWFMATASAAALATHRLAGRKSL
jgi:MFS transporter, DHA1 family, multidrug resistance protein